MKRRKRLISKAVAMVLSLVMMLSMGITVFADSLTNDTTGSFTVNGLDGSENLPVTVSAYKIIDVTIDNTSGQPVYPMYKWNTSVAEWVTGNYEDYIGNDNEVIDFNSISADQMNDFLQSMTAQIKGGSIIPTVETMTSESDSVTFDNMQMGVYLLTVSGGVKLYQPTTVSLLPVESNGVWDIDTDAEVTMKSDEPTIVKTVTDSDKTVAIGDTVHYQLTVDIPDYPVGATAAKLVVKDNLSAGLTFNSESIKVYLGTSILGASEVTSSNYQFNSPSADGKYDFEIDFIKEFIMLYLGEKLTITYSATVNENAFETDALGNTALIGYNNDPYNDKSYKEKNDDEKVYTYGIQLTKYKKDGDTKATISGAQFSLSKEDGTALKFKEESDGVYVLDNNNGSTTVKVASNGNLSLKGLDAGEYVLKETKAPSGCVLPSGEITITISDSKPEDGKIDVFNVETSGSSQVESAAIDSTNTNVIKFDVINQDSDFTLPETGGIGTLIFTVLGISFMAGAVMIMIAISKKRKS